MASGNIDLIEDNQLTEEYFSGYEEERNFIVDHYREYGNTPDTATFLSKFPEDEIIEVTEKDSYLIKTIREEYLYSRLVPVVQKVVEISQTDSNLAVEYLLEATTKLQPNYDLGGIDIISKGITRYNEFIERKKKPEEWFFTTGFPELDDLIHGIERKEELLVIFARTNQGKSWVLEKISTHIWEIGFNVGYISPEMGASSVGYRFDTLYKQFNNKALVWGNNEVTDEDYKRYIDELTKRKNKFIVATPKDFDRKITVTKLRNWIKQYDLNAIAIDGITYLADERGKRGDTKSTTLTNISEDLMTLSTEVGVPILTVVQANRNGAVDGDSDDLPELTSIRDSDGISFNASKVIALRQNKDGDLLMQVKKQRNGLVGKKVAYKWNPNIGEFINIPMNNDTSSHSDHKPRNDRKEKVTQTKEDVF